MLFDGDIDFNNSVENYFKIELSKFQIINYLLVSTPCFENTLIDFCKCQNCKTQIQSIISSINNPKLSKCDKHKTNFSSLKCFINFNGRQVKADSLVDTFNQSDLNCLTTNQSLLTPVNSIIFKKISIYSSLLKLIIHLKLLKLYQI